MTEEEICEILVLSQQLLALKHDGITGERYMLEGVELLHDFSFKNKAPL